MAIPDRQMKISSRRGTCRTALALPVTSTMTQAMTSTTPVRMAVPRLDSTPWIPTFPRMAVRLANIAEPKAQSIQPFPETPREPSCCFFSIIRKVPAPISTTPIPWNRPMGSPSRRNAIRMVSTVLDLSMGTTLLISPI